MLDKDSQLIFEAYWQNTNFEIKRIGYATYLKKGNHVAEIKGPYRPGSVWKTEIYEVKPEFEEAWNANTLTPVQRGRVTPEWDRIATALSWGSGNSIDPELTIKQDCIGYLYKSKREAMEAARKHLEGVK